MTEQSNSAAERSAHVTRAPPPTVKGSSIVELSSGVCQLRVVVELEREMNRLRAALQCAADLLRDIAHDMSVAAYSVSEEALAKQEGER